MNIFCIYKFSVQSSILDLIKRQNIKNVNLCRTDRVNDNASKVNIFNIEIFFLLRKESFMTVILRDIRQSKKH